MATAMLEPAEPALRVAWRDVEEVMPLNHFARHGRFAFRHLVRVQGQDWWVDARLDVSAEQAVVSYARPAPGNGRALRGQTHVVFDAHGRVTQVTWKPHGRGLAEPGTLELQPWPREQPVPFLENLLGGGPFVQHPLQLYVSMRTFEEASIGEQTTAMGRLSRHFLFARDGGQERIALAKFAAFRQVTMAQFLHEGLGRVEEAHVRSFLEDMLDHRWQRLDELPSDEQASFRRWWQARSSVRVRESSLWVMRVGMLVRSDFLSSSGARWVTPLEARLARQCELDARGLTVAANHERRRLRHAKLQAKVRCETMAGAALIQTTHPQEGRSILVKARHPGQRSVCVSDEELRELHQWGARGKVYIVTLRTNARTGTVQEHDGDFFWRHAQGQGRGCDVLLPVS